MMAGKTTVLTGDEYEAATIKYALAGDPDAGREALSLCRAALDSGNISRQLAGYLAERLWLIDQALDEAEKLRKVKRSSGSIRSARDAAIAEALCIKRPAKKPQDPIPEWQTPLAAVGIYLRRHRATANKCHDAMSDARLATEHKMLDRREAQRILKSHSRMWRLKDCDLLHFAGAAAREILPTYIPRSKKR